MPKIKTEYPPTPKTLRPYLFHGVSLDYEEGKDQVYGDCPFCGKEGKLGVKVATGEWRCYVCAAGTDKGGGNSLTFIRLLLDRSLERTTEKEYSIFASTRKLLSPSTLKAWGLAVSYLTRDWLVPGYNAKGNIVQVYRYLKDRESGRFRCLPTPELGTGYFRPQEDWDGRKEGVYVCEGVWDAMAAWEVLRIAKRGEGRLSLTSAESLSLAGTANVMGVPSCGSVGKPFEHWLPIFSGKRVSLLFHNDHEHEHQGKKVEGAGYAATKRAAALLSSVPELTPAEVQYINWGPKGYDDGLPSGYDVRDIVGSLKEPRERVGSLGSFLTRLTPVPSEWVPGRSKAAPAGGVDVDLLPCTAWKELKPSWQKAMKFIDGLDVALSVCLACVVSTRMPGDQLWIQMISPPSTGKTAIADALGVAKKWVKGVGNFRGFHSGFQTDKDGGEDHSLLGKLKDKTFVVKDGDTVLKSPARDQILAEARDAYDTNCSVAYRNSVKRDYVGLRFTWILCGTEALLEMDSADLGARFLTCIIMEGIDPELESAVNKRTFFKVFRNRGTEANGTLETHDDPAMLKAKQLTGGYVDYLRENATELLSSISDDNAEELVEQFDNLAQFVAYMRARPSKTQEEATTREMSARLNSQLTRLGICLAVVLNRPRIDQEVMRRVTKVALDTARGRALELIRHLAEAGEQGLETSNLARKTGHSEEKERTLLRFMKKIGAVEWFQLKEKGVSGKPKWRLTQRMARIFREVSSYAKQE